MCRTNNRNRSIAVAVFGVLLLVAWFLYSPALSGTFLLDDHGNLDGLKNVNDLRSALQFVVSGDSGPLGRPLALASFLPQAASMASDPKPFLQFNIQLHLFNASVLAYFLYCLCVSQISNQRTALFVAISAATIWLFMPLLSSASMMIVQRMTTLSATFALLGLIGYLHARAAIHRNSRRALVGMSFALIAGTLLAALAKENGALLPTLVLTIEATLLCRPKQVNTTIWRAWIFVFLLLPTLVIVGYLASCIPYSEELVLRRDFTGWERLLTQSRVLWEYLLNSFVPRPAEFGPFHDGYPVARTILDPLTFLAISGWVVTIGLAVRWRRRYPIIAFAVLWFVGGHLLESTVLPLELYFEHRNYLPIVGPIFALCFTAAQAPVAKRKLAYVGLPLYALVNAAALLSVTSLWGEPAVAAHFWYERHPDSVRAATNFASYHLGTNGEERALETVHEFAQHHPNDGYLGIQELKLRCVFSPAGDHQKVLTTLMRRLPGMHFTYSSATALSSLAVTVADAKCNGVDLEIVRTIAQRLMLNPRYRQDVMYNQIHHQIMAQIANHQLNYADALRHLERAIDYRPDSQLNTKVVSVYIAAGRFSEARAFIDAARKMAPLNPLKRYEWLSNLEDLSYSVSTLEQQYTPAYQPQ